jgi:hypothetical protein
MSSRTTLSIIVWLRIVYWRASILRAFSDMLRQRWLHNDQRRKDVVTVV